MIHMSVRHEDVSDDVSLCGCQTADIAKIEEKSAFFPGFPDKERRVSERVIYESTLKRGPHMFCDIIAQKSKKYCPYADLRPFVGHMYRLRWDSIRRCNA